MAHPPDLRLEIRRELPLIRPMTTKQSSFTKGSRNVKVTPFEYEPTTMAYSLITIRTSPEICRIYRCTPLSSIRIPIQLPDSFPSSWQAMPAFFELQMRAQTAHTGRCSARVCL